MALLNNLSRVADIRNFLETGSPHLELLSHHVELLERHRANVDSAFLRHPARASNSFHQDVCNLRSAHGKVSSTHLDAPLSTNLVLLFEDYIV